MNENKRNTIRKRLTKKDILTIPNLLTCIRILLIPIIISLYAYGYDVAAVSIILLSAATDIADGIIARKCNMISDLGKFIDPVADKLTQGVICICLASKHPKMWILIAVLLIKETLMFLMGCLVLRFTDTVAGAKWYGKACTVITESIIMLFVLWSGIPNSVANILIDICITSILISFILYAQFYAKLLKNKLHEIAKNKKISSFIKIIVIFLWLCVIAFFVSNRKSFTLNGIIQYTPQNPLLTVVMMLFLFALKSISVIIYMGILYAASGILFPLPIALAVNIIGTAISLSIPYFLGKWTGSDIAAKIVEKYPKTAYIRSMRKSNDFMFSFIVRIIGILPADLVSFYMGANGVEYKKYLFGGLLGFSASMITFPIMGMSVSDPSSPAFIISLSIEAALLATSVIFCLLKKHSLKSSSNNE